MGHTDKEDPSKIKNLHFVKNPAKIVKKEKRKKTYRPEKNICKPNT